MTDSLPTVAEYHARLIALAVEAGADPERAKERIAQAAQAYACVLGELAEMRK